MPYLFNRMLIKSNQFSEKNDFKNYRKLWSCLAEEVKHDNKQVD